MLLKHIDQTKATGTYELPARILKETANFKEIAGVLSVIFQQSYEDGTVPSNWPTARISAIYQKGDKANPSNYRQSHSHTQLWSILYTARLVVT